MSLQIRLRVKTTTIALLRESHCDQWLRITDQPPRSIETPPPNRELEWLEQELNQIREQRAKIPDQKHFFNS